MGPFPEPGQSVLGFDEAHARAIMDKISPEVFGQGWMQPKKPVKFSVDSAMKMFSQMMSSCFSFGDAAYDNSSAFARYLQRHHTETIANNVGLKLKKKHTILPHRLFSPKRGSPQSLPDFSDPESLYFNLHLGHYTLCERFVEFGLA
ncbi:hypothetical protein ABKN59_007406 [Abortiporus biennis]